MKREIAGLLICILTLSVATPTALAEIEVPSGVINIDSVMCDEMDDLGIAEDEFKAAPRNC